MPARRATEAARGKQQHRTRVNSLDRPFQPGDRDAQNREEVDEGRQSKGEVG